MSESKMKPRLRAEELTGMISLLRDKFVRSENLRRFWFERIWEDKGTGSLVLLRLYYEVCLKCEKTYWHSKQIFPIACTKIKKIINTIIICLVLNTEAAAIVSTLLRPLKSDFVVWRFETEVTNYAHPPEPLVVPLHHFKIKCPCFTLDQYNTPSIIPSNSNNQDCISLIFCDFVFHCLTTNNPKFWFLLFFYFFQQIAYKIQTKLFSLCNDCCWLWLTILCLQHALRYKMYTFYFSFFML